MEEIKGIRKVMRIGAIPIANVAKAADIFIEAEIKDGELLISGVIGPKPSGNSYGGAGQIDMEFEHRNPNHNDRRYADHLIKASAITYAPGWNMTRWFNLLDIWKKWHLNHMRPNCEHQTGPEWEGSKELTLYYFRTKKHVQDAIHNYMENAKIALRGGYAIQASPEEQRLALLPGKLTLASAELTPELAQDYEPEGPHYEGDHYNKPSEKKLATWVYPKDHPEGILTKPCPICGYEYGRAWKKEALPQSVINFILCLPEADIAPAWV